MSKTAATIAIRPRFFFCLAGAAGKRESLITEGIGGEPRTGEEMIAFVREGWVSVSTTNIYTLIVIKSSRSCLFTSVKIVSTVSLRLLCLISNKTEAVALAMRCLLEKNARATSMFGAHQGSVQVREGVDLVAPTLDVVPDAESGKEIDR
jgi:hypothetical protein